MFTDTRLKMLTIYVLNIDIPIFDNKILSYSSFVFIRKERKRFLDRVVKYNILHDIDNHLTIYIPCAICNGDKLDNCYNSTTNNYNILNDMIFYEWQNGNISLNNKFNDKQYILIEFDNNEIEKIAKNIFVKTLVSITLDILFIISTP